MSAIGAASRAIDLLVGGLGARRSGTGWKALCPCHADRNPSLSISQRNDGQPLVHCHAGCPQDRVLAALRARGLWSEMAPSRNGHANGASRLERPKVTRFEFRDAAGTLLAIHNRTDLPNGDKEMPWLLPDGTMSRNGQIKPERLPLYRLAQLLAAPADSPVYLVEGEKAADAAGTAGLIAVSLAGGAGQRDFGAALEPLGGRNVILWPDNDEPGRTLMYNVAAALRGSAASVRVLDVPDLPPKGDAFDYFAAGRTAKELEALCCVPDPRHEAQPQQAHQQTMGDAAAGVLVDGDALLNDVADFLGQYVSFPSSEARDAVALWAAHAHALHAFESTPRLALLSAEKQSGKTRCLEVLELLVPEAKHAANLTAAALFRLVGREGGCTLLFDEVDVFFGSRAKEHEELRGLLNAGHRRGAVAYRCVGDGAKMEVRAFPAFCAVALAGIGDLPDTIQDRAVLVRMRRRAPDEAVHPFRRREVQGPGSKLRDGLAQWTAQHRGELEQARPVMPDGIVDRPADVWEPLLAIADVAGGQWPARARCAAVHLNATRQDADPSLGVRLLSDIRTVFREKATGRLASAALAEALVALEEAPWGDLRGKALDARGLARRLNAFGIRPKVIRIDNATPRGYELADFADLWKRYLPPSQTSATSATAATTRVGGVAEVGPCCAPDPQQDAPPQQGLQVGVAAVALVAHPTDSGVLAVPEGEELGEWSA